MNYRANNYGNNYQDTNNNRLGYSSVSKGYGYSNRSTFLFKKIMEMTIKILEKSNLCSKTKGKSSNKPSRSTSTILTIKEKWGSNSKTNSSSSKTSLAESKSPSQNWSSKSTTCFIKIRTLSSKTKDLKTNSVEWRNCTAVKFTNCKPLWIWRAEISKKRLYSTILNLKSSKRKDNNTSNNSLSSLKEK